MCWINVTADRRESSGRRKSVVFFCSGSGDCISHRSCHRYFGRIMHNNVYEHCLQFKCCHKCFGQHNSQLQPTRALLYWCKPGCSAIDLPKWHYRDMVSFDNIDSHSRINRLHVYTRCRVLFFYGYYNSCGQRKHNCAAFYSTRTILCRSINACLTHDIQ